MLKPRILVTGAAGRTGAATAMELLAKGFPVRAFVRRRDARAAALEAAGAELFVGDIYDYRDVRHALDAGFNGPTTARPSRPICSTTRPPSRSPPRTPSWRSSRC